MIAKTLGRRISQLVNGRGKAWNETFKEELEKGSNRYRAAVVAEAKHGPHRFQREVCQLQLETGLPLVWEPAKRGPHAKRTSGALARINLGRPATSNANAPR